METRYDFAIFHQASLASRLPRPEEEVADLFIAINNLSIWKAVATVAATITTTTTTTTMLSPHSADADWTHLCELSFATSLLFAWLAIPSGASIQRPDLVRLG